MATAPRKFQEKIALLNEKAAQGTAAFQQVMQEVSTLRNQPVSPNPYGMDQCNYEYGGYDSQYIQNDQAFCDQPGRQQAYYSQGSVQGAMNDLQSLRQSCQRSGQTSLNSAAFRGGSPGHHNGARHPVSHHVSPHRTSHLTLPEMLSRSSSDSSLHQTAYQAKISSNTTTRKGSAPEERSRHMNPPYEMQKPFNNQFNNTDKQLYTHAKREHIQVPVSMQGQCLGGPSAGPGGGSLPDLTQVQYMQPMGVPLADGENTATRVDPNLGMNTFNNGFNEAYYPPTSRGTSPGPSPRLSPVFDRKHKPKPYSHPPSLTNQRHAPNHLSVPTLVTPQHFMTKALVTDNSTMQPIDTHLANSGLSILGTPHSPGSSHPSSPVPPSLMDYRNPRSPQISPCSSPVPSMNHHQTGHMPKYFGSPDSRSAPPSPASLQQSSSPVSSPGAQIGKPFLYDGYAHGQNPGTQQLNHRFQQITVMDNPSGTPSYNTNMQGQNHIPATSTSHPSSPSHSPISPGGSTSTPLSHHPETPQTPLTPNVALPRVVLTDHDGNDDKELLMNDVNELFIFDEFMLKNLSSLGEEELMSVDQIMVDTEIEESFRRDLRNTISNQQGQQIPYNNNHQYMQQGNLSSEALTGDSSSLQHSHPDLQNLPMNSPTSSDDKPASPHRITNLEPLVESASRENQRDGGISVTQSPLDSLSSSSPQEFGFSFANQIDLDLHTSQIGAPIMAANNCLAGVPWQEVSQTNPNL